MVINQSGINPARAPQPAPRAYGGGNYVDRYLALLGVPSNFSAEAATRPPTQAEVDAFRQARDARVAGRYPTGQYFGPEAPPMATSTGNYFGPPAPAAVEPQPASYPSGWPELAPAAVDAASRAAAAFKRTFYPPDDDFFKRRRDYWNSMSEDQGSVPTYNQWPLLRDE